MSLANADNKLKAVAARWEVRKRQAQQQFARAVKAEAAASAQLSQLQQLELDYARRRDAAAMPSATDLANLARLGVQLDQGLQKVTTQRDQAHALVDAARSALLAWERKLLGLERVRQAAQSQSTAELRRRERRSATQTNTKARYEDI
ncbi:MAG: hypothetical protein ACR2PZ_04670 [Pseudomonadales bacterium]